MTASLDRSSWTIVANVVKIPEYVGCARIFNASGLLPIFLASAMCVANLGPIGERRKAPSFFRRYGVLRNMAVLPAIGAGP